MIDKVRKLYEGKKFAVLGSGPSIIETFDNNNRSEDVVIGVNGAGKFLKPGDYFLSGDQIAYQRSWFNELPEEVTCILVAHAAIYSPKLYPEKALRQKLIDSYERYMDEHPRTVVWKEGQGIRCVLPGDEYIDKLFRDMPEPVEPHIIMRNITTGGPISRDQTLINYGGTSACMALQVAFIMGASEMHLYGIEFSNDAVKYKGDKYFYKAKESERGMTNDKLRVYMDTVITQMIEQGAKIISHGPTRLENPRKEEEIKN